MQVIFHGDDFGLTSGVNEGVIQAFQNGVLTSTSIIASGQAVDEAIGLARTYPDLDVGIHLVLSDEKALQKNSSPACPSSSDEKFPSRQRLLLNLLNGQTTVREVETEWRAQIEKILSAGLPVSHLDSHQHVHLYPYLFPLTVRLGIEYNIPFIRSRILDPILSIKSSKRFMDTMILKCWIAGYISNVRIKPLKSIPSIGFLHAGGKLNQDILMDMLKTLDEKSCPAVEVMLHPGTGDPYTHLCYRHWRYNWKNDLDVSIHPLTVHRLKQLGIAPVSFSQLHKETLLRLRG
jgi:chitin disaccharide deacetylase